MLSSRSLAAASLVLALATAPAQAQQYGRWWWDGLVSAGERRYENLIDGQSVGDSTQRDYRLSLGLNGYLGHPALGSFRVGLEGLSSDLSATTATTDSDQLGGSLSLNLLPRSNYPATLALRRSSFGYGWSGDLSAFSFAAAPKSIDSAEARLRLRAGPLRGTSLGYQSSIVEFQSSTLEPERRSRAFADWDRSFGAFDNRLRLEREANDFSLGSYSTRLSTATFDQLARLGARWDWQVSAAALRNELDFRDAKSKVDDYRLLWRVARELESRDLADLRLEASAVRSGEGSNNSGYGGTFTYRLRRRPGFELAPYAQAAEIAGDEFSITSWRTGVGATWALPGRIDFSLNGTLGTGFSSFRGQQSTLDDRNINWLIGLSLGYGDAQRLRSELEAEVGQNQLRFSRVAQLPLDELDALPAGVNDEDVARVRLGLERRGSRREASAWIEGSLRRAAVPGGIGRTELSTASLNVQTRFGSLLLSANAGLTDFSGLPGLERSVEFAGVNSTIKLLRYLDLRANWRMDRRDQPRLPGLQTQRFEAGAVFHAGFLDIHADIFESREQVAGGAERIHRGVSWGLTRALAGWLPIVTGAKRRGEIR